MLIASCTALLGATIVLFLSDKRMRLISPSIFLVGLSIGFLFGDLTIAPPKEPISKSSCQSTRHASRKVTLGS